MLNLTLTMISSVDLAHYGISRAENWISVDCGTMYIFRMMLLPICSVAKNVNCLLFFKLYTCNIT